MDRFRFHHICEVCLRDEILSPDEAFASGWDYPPRMGHFGIISPRLCPDCPTPDTVWWALMMMPGGGSADALTERQRAAVARMLAEPESLRAEP
jgi:hypothetical protein